MKSKNRAAAIEYMGRSKLWAIQGLKRERHEHSWTVRNGRDTCKTCPYVAPRQKEGN